MDGFRLSSTLSLLLLYGVAHAQVGKIFKSNESRGDDYFYDFSYPQAIEEYKIAYTKTNSPDISLKVAESYRKLNDPQNASDWYAKAVEGEMAEPEVYLHYAEALSSMEEYDLAKLWYKKYQSVAGSDNRPAKKISVLENLQKIADRTSEIKVDQADFNSQAADFSPTFYDNDQILFVSSRNRKRAIKGLFNWDNSEYLDLFLLDSLGKVIALDKKINSKYHEGPAAVYQNGSQMIFTRNDYLGNLGKSEDGTTKLKMYTSVRTGGEWTTPLEFPYNSSEYSVGHPTVSEDGETLIFISDMQGGYGGTDLYASEWTDSGWSKPVNMGERVNTEGDEMFPFLSQENELFFASDGYGGLGGLDMFGIKLGELNKAIPVNLGTPLNSSLDDFGLIVRGDKGYFSSNRLGGKNNDDVYSFNAKVPLIPAYKVKGTITHQETGVPLKKAIVYLNDPSGKELRSVETDENGNYEFAVEPEKMYVINVSKDEFLENSANLNVDDKTKLDWTKNVSLKPDYGFNLLGEIVERGGNAPIQGVQVEMIDNMTGKKTATLTTADGGKFVHSIEDKELNDRVSYQIKLSKAGYLTKTVTFNSELKKPGTINLKDYLDLNLDKIEVGTDIGKLLDLKPIYFDLGKAIIRPDAAEELDKVVEIMLDNPSIEIELGAHTDSRGRAESNMRLSDKRAKASANYIVSKGIDASRIVGRGFGESVLINRCADGVKCTEEEHQLNRRTEFRVTKIK